MIFPYDIDRKGREYMVNNIFALDIGGSKTVCGIVTTDGTIIKTYRFDYPNGTTIDQILNLISDCRNRLAEYECIACCAAIPGLAETETGVWKYSPFSGISDIPMAEHLKKITGLPSFVDNDVNLSALAEAYYGVCRNTKDFLWVTVSNGIGGGLVLNGQLYRGAGMCAGEIGHLIVEEHDGLPCGCGRSGCLEAMAAGASFAPRYERLTGVRKTAGEIALLAKNGDEAAIKIFADTGHYIGKAAAIAVNLLNLETVVIGGGVSNSFEVLKPSLEKAFYEHVFLQANPNAKVIKTEVGYYAAFIGCAVLAAIRTERDGKYDK